MSINFASQFSMEDNESVTESPPQSMQKCTRDSPLSRPDCISCTGPANNSHVRNLTDDLEVTPVKVTIPPNHWIITITKAFKDAIQDRDATELKMTTDLYQRHMDVITVEDLTTTAPR